MARLHAEAHRAPAEHARYLTRRAQQVARSLPICEYVERKKELGRQESEADPTMERTPDGWTSIRATYRAMRDELKSANRYAAGRGGRS